MSEIIEPVTLMTLYNKSATSHLFNGKLYGVKSNLCIKNSSSNQHLKTQSLQNKSKKRNEFNESRVRLTAIPPWPTESQPNVEDLRINSQIFDKSSDMISSDIVTRMAIRNCATRKQNLELVERRNELVMNRVYYILNQGDYDAVLPDSCLENLSTVPISLYDEFSVSEDNERKIYFRTLIESIVETGKIRDSLLRETLFWLYKHDKLLRKETGKKRGDTINEKSLKDSERLMSFAYDKSLKALNRLSLMAVEMLNGSSPEAKMKKILMAAFKTCSDANKKQLRHAMVASGNKNPNEIHKSKNFSAAAADNMKIQTTFFMKLDFISLIQQGSQDKEIFRDIINEISRNSDQLKDIREAIRISLFTLHDIRLMNQDQKKNIRWTLFLFTLVEEIIKNREELALLKEMEFQTLQQEFDAMDEVIKNMVKESSKWKSMYDDLKVTTLQISEVKNQMKKQLSSLEKKLIEYKQKIIKLEDKIFNIENEKEAIGAKYKGVQPPDQKKSNKPLLTLSFIEINRENDLISEFKENSLKEDESKFEFIDTKDEDEDEDDSIAEKSIQSPELLNRNTKKATYSKTHLRLVAEKLKDMSVHARDIESRLKDRERKLEKVMESLEDAKEKLQRKEDIIKQLQNETKNSTNQQIVGNKIIKKKNKGNKLKSYSNLEKFSKIRLDSENKSDKLQDQLIQTDKQADPYDSYERIKKESSKTERIIYKNSLVKLLIREGLTDESNRVALTFSFDEIQSGGFSSTLQQHNKEMENTFELFLASIKSLIATIKKEKSLHMKVEKDWTSGELRKSHQDLESFEESKNEIKDEGLDKEASSSGNNEDLVTTFTPSFVSASDLFELKKTPKVKNQQLKRYYTTDDVITSFRKCNKSLNEKKSISNRSKSAKPSFESQKRNFENRLKMQSLDLRAPETLAKEQEQKELESHKAVSGKQIGLSNWNSIFDKKSFNYLLKLKTMYREKIHQLTRNFFMMYIRYKRWRKRQRITFNLMSDLHNRKTQRPLSAKEEEQLERLNNYYWNMKMHKTQMKEEMGLVQNENGKDLKVLRMKILNECQHFLARLKDKEISVDDAFEEMKNSLSLEKFQNESDESFFSKDKKIQKQVVEDVQTLKAVVQETSLQEIRSDKKIISRSNVTKNNFTSLSNKQNKTDEKTINTDYKDLKLKDHLQIKSLQKSAPLEKNNSRDQQPIIQKDRKRFLRKWLNSVPVRKEKLKDFEWLTNKMKPCEGLTVWQFFENKVDTNQVINTLIEAPFNIVAEQEMSVRNTRRKLHAEIEKSTLNNGYSHAYDSSFIKWRSWLNRSKEVESSTSIFPSVDLKSFPLTV